MELALLTYETNRTADATKSAARLRDVDQSGVSTVDRAERLHVQGNIAHARGRDTPADRLRRWQIFGVLLEAREAIERKG